MDVKSIFVYVEISVTIQFRPVLRSDSMFNRPFEAEWSHDYNQNKN